MLLLSILGRHRPIGARSHTTADGDARDDRRDVVFFAADDEMDGATQRVVAGCPSPSPPARGQTQGNSPTPTPALNFYNPPPKSRAPQKFVGPALLVLAVLRWCAHDGGDRPRHA
jgi:hypothetical protein